MDRSGSHTTPPSTTDRDVFRSVVDDVSDSILVVGPSGDVRYANRAVGRLLDRSPDDLVARSLASLLADRWPEPADVADRDTNRAARRLAALEQRFTDTDDLTDAVDVVFPVERGDGTVVLVSADFSAHGDEGTGERFVSARIRSVDDRRCPTRSLSTFRDLVEQAAHAIYVTDTEGTITYVNPAFTEHTGYTAAEAVGRTPAILNSGEMSEAYFEDLWTTLHGGGVWEEEIVDRRKSGDLYHAHQTITPVFDGEEIARFVAIQTDVTERKESERRLEQYREVVHRLADPIMLQDLDGRFQLVNDAVAGFTGIPREELLGVEEPAFMDAETAETIADRKREVVETGEPVRYEVTPTFEHTGHRPTFSTQRYPYYDDGELVGTVAICRDVSRLKQREQELRRYKLAITGATDLICALDLDGGFIFANPQYCAYHGLDRERIGERSLADAFDDADRYEEAVAHVERARRGETVEYRTTRTHPAEGERTLDVRYYPLREDGSVVGVVAVLRDVTEEENRARQLRVVDRVLKHNLRNELNIVRGRAEQIRTESDGEIGAAATDVVRHANNLLAISDKSRRITEILNAPSRVQAIDVGRTVRNAVASVTDDRPHTNVAVHGPDHVEAAATDHLQTAVEELVTNAVVHSDRTAPSVAVVVEADDESVRIRVVDDGPTIPAMDRDVLETGDAIDAVYHGSGLGVWMVYWIVQQCGGSVEVREGPSGGNDVSIVLSPGDRD
ncbi:PAS domain S-box protein [Halorubrum sp. JWXQ-INN 858]|uniref:PAS domain S-box protein n=1 Tax=Halorubrum sp. JWXQ-INN 858 TaxID=2690782 RepID=UPI00135B1E3F|nr:PAS domain S-box protein [Halorubrum sp. JWXQ-INN 858]MWV64577.1 PAS domain S-box protein [Halorubrum sp. JWXQ-INN 858]